MDTQTSKLNPYEAPPQDLKNIFKSWRGPITQEKDKLLDLKSQTVELPSLESSHLEHVFHMFVQDSASNGEYDTSTVDNSGVVYRSKEIEGLLILPALLPPSIQQQFLSRLLHRDLSIPAHKTNLHLHYNVQYPDQKASFFSRTPEDVQFQPKDPGVHPALTSKSALEKKLRWITLGGQYDWTNKVYPAEEPPKFPADIAGFLQDLFPEMEPQAGIVNFYSPGDTLSLHRDVSEEVDRGLVSISIGCDAIFVIGVWDKDFGKTRNMVLRLQSGDALYMSGESRFAWHGVPKIISGTCPKYLADWPGDEYPQWRGWMSNKRINLNVRQMRDSIG